MREIKFRGKRVDNGEWVYGYYFKTPLTQENVNDCDSKDGWFFLCGKTRYCISNNDGVVYQVHPETVGEFTGLKDKNGKDIWEGDVCKAIHQEQNGNNPFEKIEIVYPQPGGFSIFGKPMQDFSYDGQMRILAFHWVSHGLFNIPDIYYKITDVEIIGNIHDNPELLNPSTKG